MRKAAIGLALLGALLMALPAAAQTGEIQILVIVTLIGETPGSVHLVATEPVPEDLIGATCSGTAQTENNASEWDFNDLIIESGGNSAVIPDFEALAGGTTFMAGTLVLGSEIDVSIRIGPGGTSSEGTLIILNCSQPEPTTTTTVAATTTTDPGEPTTTTAPPVATTTTTPTGTEEGETPEGGVAAGGGATANGGGGLGLLMLGLGASAIVGAGFLAMASRDRDTRKE